jgi:hypothetical protein
VEVDEDEAIDDSLRASIPSVSNRTCSAKLVIIETTSVRSFSALS